MGGNSSLKAIIFIAAISSAIQGIIWCILSLLVILCYSCILKPGPYKFGNEIRLSYHHYLAAYFQGNCDENLDFYKELHTVTSADKLLILTIFVYIFNFAMAIVSIILMFALRSKRRHILLGWLIFYLIITFCVSILDLISTGVVASDYFVVYTSASCKNCGLAGLALIVIIIIISRGMFLWIANLVFSIYLIIFICRSQKHQTSPAAVHTNSATKEESAVSNPSKFGEVFKVDSKAMEDRPIVILNPEKTNDEYPPYSAYSRWPRLHPDNRILKPTTERTPNNQEQLERHQRERKVQKELQKHLQQLRPKSSPPAPPTPYYTPTTVDVVTKEQDVNHSNVRPDSLQEAILTVKALNKVRPRITAIPDSYP